MSRLFWRLSVRDVSVVNGWTVRAPGYVFLPMNVMPISDSRLRRARVTEKVTQRLSAM